MMITRILILLTLAATLSVAQDHKGGPPCDNLESTPTSHRCHCYDTASCPADHSTPRGSGSMKCKKYCDEKHCQCSDSCAS